MKQLALHNHVIIKIFEYLSFKEFLRATEIFEDAGYISRYLAIREIKTLLKNSLFPVITSFNMKNCSTVPLHYNQYQARFDKLFGTDILSPDFDVKFDEQVDLEFEDPLRRGIVCEVLCLVQYQYHFDERSPFLEKLKSSELAVKMVAEGCYTLPQIMRSCFTPDFIKWWGY
jgi:hypothetical protein